jgi:hypothetical protein
MTFTQIVHQLKMNKEAIRSVLINITEEQARWSPSDDRWTVLEAACHLLDIEREDFRYDLELILYHPEDSWPQFDIETWRQEREYNRQELESVSNQFYKEREKSVDRLNGLGEANLYAEHSGNGFGGKKITAGDVLLSWAAHDFYHIRQIALLRWEIMNKWGGDFSPVYSGFCQ